MPTGTSRPTSSTPRRLHPLRDPRVVWAIVAVLAAHLVYANVLGFIPPLHRPDGETFLVAGARWLHDPGAIYAGINSYAQHYHYLPQALYSPPTLAVLAAPFSLFPHLAGLILFTVADAAALLGAFVILDRRLELSGVERAWYWVVIAWYPPILAETTASQISGFVVVFGVLTIALAQRRPILAGIACGLGIALKLYPAAQLFGAGRRRAIAITAGATLSAVVAVSVGFLRPGVIGPITYLHDVMLPAAQYPPVHDCAVVSLPSLWARVVGGQYVYSLDGARHTYLAAPAVASAGLALSIAALVGLTVWAAARARGNAAFGTALGLGLGALFPGDVHTYQVIPLLPVVLMVLVTAARRGRTRTVIALVAGLATMADQPCSLFFPNIWTLGMLELFVVCAWAAPLFATNDVADPVADAGRPLAR